MNNHLMMRVRVLTATDLHQSQLHFKKLAQAVSEYRPDVVALVGDVLDALQFSSKTQFTTKECARQLAALPVEHLLFVRGNHEDFSWPEFVAAWPHAQRPLMALYGTACAVGPLVIVGFPCMVGSEFHWCARLSASDNTMEEFPIAPRQPLASDFDTWLPGLMRKTGPAGRVLWLMHEPPAGLPLAGPRLFNPIWTTAVERFSPALVIAGHDHTTPLLNNAWHVPLSRSICVNVGQTPGELHYTLMDFKYADASLAVPSQIKIQAFPWDKATVIRPADQEGFIR